MLNVFLKLTAMLCLILFRPVLANDADCALKSEVKSAASTEFCSTPMEINQGMIAFADGKSKAALDRVFKMIVLKRNLKKLREGDNGKGMIVFGASRYTVQQLVALEHDAALDKQSMATLLELALNEFQKMTAGYMQEAKGLKAPTLAVILQWSVQRNRPETILKEWSSQPAGTEHENMRKLVTSFAILDQFVCDLYCFLSDMSNSCKVAMAELIKQTQKVGHK